MTDDPSTSHIDQDDLAALALGLLGGEQRAIALSHVDSCTQCASALEQYSLGADGLIQLAPEFDPPVGFEVRVLERMHLERPPVRSLRTSRLVIGAAAASLAALLGLGIGHFVVPTSSHAPTIASAPAHKTVLTATLVGHGKPRGTVVVFGGDHPWLMMSMYSVPNGTSVICKVQTNSGQLLTVGSYALTEDSHSWSARLPVPVNKVHEVVITSSNGSEIASAPIVS